ncbi:Alpha/Beta hydrolase protein [Xylariaceae sp. FL0804]|nr:Alpha/Beta hydrolase protein [Xylariaceae sp. FL0804]
MVPKSISAFVLLAAAASAVCTGRRQQQPTVTIGAGEIIGVSTPVPSAGATVNKFLGIPYAAPPVDQLRFALPRAPAPWPHSPLHASAFGNACMQMGSSTLSVNQSEDCLYLNVFAPSAPATGGRTVMVWIHGGALKTGAASTSTYDGTSFAANQDVVLVSINYRLNVFGLPNAPALPIEKSNLAFYDQRAALSWVRDNIAAFGGDPAKVTVFGESSGSTSVSRLESTMHEDPLFRAAIMESGVYDYGYTSGGLTNVEGVDAWSYLVEQLNCTSSAAPSSGVPEEEEELACVRDADALAIQQVVSNNSALVFAGVNDNVTQYAYPEREREAGHIARVPILLGHNLDDGSLFTDTSFTTLDLYVDAYPDLKPVQDRIAAGYPVGNGSGGYASQWAANAASRTDDLFTCPVARVARATAALGLPVWRYVFNATFPDYAQPPYGVYHASELALVFGTYDNRTATADEAALSAAMQTAWADFAKDPHGAGPGWPRASVPRQDGGGGGYAMAALGSLDGNRVGATVIRSGVVDGNCGIYDSSYEEGQGEVAWW